MDLSAPMALADCLGCSIERDENNKIMWLHQAKLIKELLAKNNLEPRKCKTVATPLTPGVKLTKADCPSQVRRRRW